jgi:hypothetical protein
MKGKQKTISLQHHQDSTCTSLQNVSQVRSVNVEVAIPHWSELIQFLRRGWSNSKSIACNVIMRFFRHLIPKGVPADQAEDLKSLKVLSDENIDLKVVIEKLREVNAKSLKEKDEEIDSLKFQNRDLEEKQTSIINSKSQKIIEQNNVITTKTNEIAKLRSDLACTKCDYKAETTSALISHVIMKHETREDLELSCKDCDYKCIKEFDLQLHKSAKHPGNLIAFTGFTKMKPTKSNFLYTRTNEFK